MEKIKKLNCEGMCIETYCDNPYTHFEEIELKGIKILVALCNYHARIWKVGSGICPECDGKNLKDKGSFDKCLDCGTRINADHPEGWQGKPK